MGRRSRSRSPKRERRRSKDRDRERDRDRDRKGRRSRSRSPRRQRSRSPRRRSNERRFDRDRDRERDRDRDRDRSFRHEDSPPKKKKQPPNATQMATRPPLDASAFIGKSEEEVAMMNVMGFGNFDSTKGKHVPGNEVGNAHIVEKRRYRQYMNRRGGFNRPLDQIA